MFLFTFWFLGQVWWKALVSSTKNKEIYILYFLREYQIEDKGTHELIFLLWFFLNPQWKQFKVESKQVWFCLQFKVIVYQLVVSHLT